MNAIPSASPQKFDLRSAVLKRMAQVVFVTLLYAVILFGTSGHLDWGAAWAYLAVSLGTIALNAIVILPRDPALIAERGQAKTGTKDWDRIPGLIVGLLGPLAIMVVAGLDARFGWSPPPALAVQIGGLVLVILGFALFSWAMASNRFFSGLVRIQQDRGHAVAHTGPYRLVRHPGYVGLALQYLGMPLLFGALWAFVPAILTLGVLIYRTRLEDQTLQAELDGYRDYARQVRYRLLPGIW